MNVIVYIPAAIGQTKIDVLPSWIETNVTYCVLRYRLQDV